MHVYITTSPIGDVFRPDRPRALQKEDAKLPHFVWENITFGDWNDHRVEKLDVPIPPVRVHAAAKRVC